VNFIIHTHQSMASAVSVLEIKSIPSPGFSELGENVPIADYGLPGSGKLRENVGKAIERCGGHAVIMAHHGALCFGECYEEAFRAARQLEEACSAFMRGRYLEISGAQSFNEKEFYGFYASKALGEGTLGKNPGLSGNSRRIKRGFIMESENNKEYGFDDGVFSENALLHGAIYLKRKDVNFIEQATDGGLFEASYTGRPVLPMLDDFAQIIGDKAECAKSAKPEHVVMALKNRAAVLIPGSGAVCCTAEKDDLNAVRFIMGKNMLAQICGEFFGSGRKLSLLDCAVMRFIYTKSYSKKAKNNYK
ncbi:MAG: class II aldolase/adducin family protein, partial [Bacillota bacterium]|nr:class II aldolase/adducin family protein [Bacillota bacterium]